MPRMVMFMGQGFLELQTSGLKGVRADDAGEMRHSLKPCEVK